MKILHKFNAPIIPGAYPQATPYEFTISFEANEVSKAQATQGALQCVAEGETSEYLPTTVRVTTEHRDGSVRTAHVTCSVAGSDPNTTSVLVQLVLDDSRLGDVEATTPVVDSHTADMYGLANPNLVMVALQDHDGDWWRHSVTVTAKEMKEASQLPGGAWGSAGATIPTAGPLQAFKETDKPSPGSVRSWLKIYSGTSVARLQFVLHNGDIDNVRDQTLFRRMVLLLPGNLLATETIDRKNVSATALPEEFEGFNVVALTSDGKHILPQQQSIEMDLLLHTMDALPVVEGIQDGYLNQPVVETHPISPNGISFPKAEDVHPVADRFSYQAQAHLDRAAKGQAHPGGGGGPIGPYHPESGTYGALQGGIDIELHPGTAVARFGGVTALSTLEHAHSYNDRCASLLIKDGEAADPLAMYASDSKLFLSPNPRTWTDRPAGWHPQIWVREGPQGLGYRQAAATQVHPDLPDYAMELYAYGDIDCQHLVRVSLWNIAGALVLGDPKCEWFVKAMDSKVRLMFSYGSGSGMDYWEDQINKKPGVGQDYGREVGHALKVSATAELIEPSADRRAWMKRILTGLLKCQMRNGFYQSMYTHFTRAYYGDEKYRASNCYENSILIDGMRAALHAMGDDWNDAFLESVRQSIMKACRGLWTYAFDETGGRAPHYNVVISDYEQDNVFEGRPPAVQGGGDGWNSQHTIAIFADLAAQGGDSLEEPREWMKRWCASDTEQNCRTFLQQQSSNNLGNTAANLAVLNTLFS